LAESVGAHAVTFDRGLAATAQFRQVPVLLLEPLVEPDSVAPSTERKRRTRPSK